MPIFKYDGAACKTVVCKTVVVIRGQEAAPAATPVAPGPARWTEAGGRDTTTA